MGVYRVYDCYGGGEVGRDDLPFLIEMISKRLPGFIQKPTKRNESEVKYFVLIGRNPVDIYSREKETIIKINSDIKRTKRLFETLEIRLEPLSEEEKCQIK